MCFRSGPLQFWNGHRIGFPATLKPRLIPGVVPPLQEERWIVSGVRAKVKSSKKYLGRFELFVLAATRKLGEGAYGAEITRYLSRILNRDITVAQVYLTLERLERGNLVRSEFTQPIRQRGGRAKRLFSLTARGVEILTETASTLKTLIE